MKDDDDWQKKEIQLCKNDHKDAFIAVLILFSLDSVFELQGSKHQASSLLISVVF